MAVWVARAGRGGLHADAFEQHGIVALGVERVPSVSGLSAEEIVDYAVSRGDVNPARARGHAAMLYRFANEMRVGDLVLTPDAVDASVLVGRITGDYEYRDEPPIPDHQHVRSVDWLGRVERAELSRQARQAIGAPMAVFKPGAQRGGRRGRPPARELIATADGRRLHLVRIGGDLPLAVHRVKRPPRRRPLPHAVAVRLEA